MEEIKQPLEKITTTIPKDIKDIIKEKNYKYNQLIGLGLLAKENNPQLIERIRNLESETEDLKKNISKIYEKFKEMQNLMFEKLIR